MFSVKSPSGYLVSLASGQSAVAHFPVAGLVPARQHCPGWVCILVIAASGELPGWEPRFPGELPGWVTGGALVSEVLPQDERQRSKYALLRLMQR